MSFLSVIQLHVGRAGLALQHVHHTVRRFEHPAFSVGAELRHQPAFAFGQQTEIVPMRTALLLDVLVEP